MKFNITLTKWWKIGLIAGSSVIAAGGLTMMLVGGLQTYKETSIKTNDGVWTAETKTYGMGWFNFDNTTDGSFFKYNDMNYEEALKFVNDMPQDLRDNMLSDAKKSLDNAKNSSVKEENRKYAVEAAENRLNFVNSLLAMQGMKSLAISGMLFLPVGLILLAGSLLLLKVKPKA